MMKAELIAPCGINCAVCSGYQREKNTCSGCNSDGYKPTYCDTCIIRNCPEKKGDPRLFCIDCSLFPCRRLKNLEKRYRVKYGEYIYDNMKLIKEKGMDFFLASEQEKWICKKCGTLLCVHKRHCESCGEINPYFTGTVKN